MAHIYLGIDIGTTSAKCLAIREDGEILAESQRSYSMVHPHQGWAEQDPEDYWLALLDVVSRCVTNCAAKGYTAGDTASMALSAQGDTLIVTDERGAPLMPAISWMDTRAQDECAELLSEAGASFWYRNLGQPMTAYSSACAVRWAARNRPDVWGRRPRFCYVPDFLAFKLTGRWVTDVPSASWSPFFCSHSRSRSLDTMDLLGVSEDQVAGAVESGEVIGELLPEAASQLGLTAGTKLTAGAFDQAAAACGAGAGVGGRSVLSCGTAWVLYFVSGSPVNDDGESLCVCCHTRPREWGLVLPFTGGSAYDWVNRVVSTDGGQRTSDAEPPIFIPHLYGGVSPDWRGDSKGSLLGLTMAHTPEDIRRAMMRGIAFEARRNLEAALPHCGRTESVRMVGGAARSDIWPQMVADILARPVELSDRLEAACVGAAKLAAGDPSLEWGARNVREVPPRPEQVKVEDRQYEKYVRFYRALLDVYGG